MTPDFLPWLAKASEYSGAVVFFIGVVLFFQNFVLTLRTRIKFRDQIAKAEENFGKKIDAAEQREDARHATLEEKQNAIMEAIADKLVSIQMTQKDIETEHVRQLGALGERMARVEAELHALRANR